jgi:hypothetical protein
MEDFLLNSPDQMETENVQNNTTGPITDSKSLDELLSSPKGIQFLGKSDVLNASLTEGALRDPNSHAAEAPSSGPGQNNPGDKVRTLSLSKPTRSSPRLKNTHSKNNSTLFNSNNRENFEGHSESNISFVTPSQSIVSANNLAETTSEINVRTRKNKRPRPDSSSENQTVSTSASTMAYIDRVASELEKLKNINNDKQDTVTPNQESLITKFVNMSVQTSDSTLSPKQQHVTFQENDNPISPAALKWWRAARSAGTRRVEHSIRASHLNSLAKHEIYPGWTLGLEPMPGFLTSNQDELLNQLKLHAQETLRLASEILMKKAEAEQQEYRGHLVTVSNIYGKDSAGLEKALGALRKALTKSGRALREKLDNRKKHLAENKIADSQLLRRMGFRDTTPNPDFNEPPRAPKPSTNRVPNRPSGPKRQRSRSPNDRRRSNSRAPSAKQPRRFNPQQPTKRVPTLSLAEMAVLKNILKKHGQ